jgi:hypothetical protein
MTRLISLSQSANLSLMCQPYLDNRLIQAKFKSCVEEDGYHSQQFKGFVRE